jgi:hypothetical protein
MKFEKNILCVNCTWPKVFHGQDFIRFWKYHYVKSLHGFLWDRHLINTITKYRKRSIQSQTTESLFLQRTQEQKPAISIVVSCLLSLVKTCLSPIYLGPNNLDAFWCTGWAWNCQTSFRFVSIHGHACFILL